MTFLQLINRVLRGLREKQATDVDDTAYVEQIGQLVNEAKTDLEDCGPWYALRTTVTGTLTPSTGSLALTSSTNERSYLMFTQGLPLAFVTTTDEERRLDVVEMGELTAIRALDPDAQEDVPYAVAFQRSNDGITAQFFPIPDAAYTVQFEFVVPQDDLAEDTDVLLVPAEPVWREALVRAMEERGEEFSGPIDRAVQRATIARANAIMRDFGADAMTFEAE